VAALLQILQVELKKEVEKAGPDALAQRKAMAEATKKIKQLEASNAKLQQKVDTLELDLSNAKAAKPAPHSVEKKADKKPGATADAGKKRDENLAQNLEKAKKDLADTEKELKKLQASHDSMVKELDSASKQLEATKKRCSDLDEQVKTLVLSVADLDEKLQKERKLRKKYLQELEDLKGKIRVYARCRPFAAYEKERKCKQCVRFVDDTTCEVDIGKKGKKEFAFDEVFAPDSRQEQARPTPPLRPRRDFLPANDPFSADFRGRRAPRAVGCGRLQRVYLRL
jgi:chromosome segregation ATPase